KPSRTADLQQIQPGGRAHPGPWFDVDIGATAAGRGHGRYTPGPKDFTAARSRIGNHQWWAETSGARPGEPDRTFVTWHEFGGPSHVSAADQPEPGQRQFRRHAESLSDQRQRPASNQPGLPFSGSGLPEWRAGDAVGRRNGY